MDIFILIESREDVSRVYHHPSEPIVGFFCLADLTHWCSDLRGYVLLLFDDVFLSQLELEWHFTGISLDCNMPPEEWLTIEYPGHCERTGEVFFLVAAIKELVFVDDPLGKG